MPGNGSRDRDGKGKDKALIMQMSHSRHSLLLHHQCCFVFRDYKRNEVYVCFRSKYTNRDTIVATITKNQTNNRKLSQHIVSVLETRIRTHLSVSVRIKSRSSIVIIVSDRIRIGV